jgi:hypothetical protein
VEDVGVHKPGADESGLLTNMLSVCQLIKLSFSADLEEVLPLRKAAQVVQPGREEVQPADAV